MDVLEAIFTRRSIRRFENRPVSPEIVEQLLKAAMYAPSARNTQSWHFVVITDRQLLDAVPTFHPYAAMIREAPLAILVCGDEQLEPRTAYWVENCSAATQNILLAAHGLGLGAVWLGIYPNSDRVEGMRRLVGGCLLTLSLWLWWSLAIQLKNLHSRSATIPNACIIITGGRDARANPKSCSLHSSARTNIW